MQQQQLPPDGALAIVLHTHMPYVEGFGTWPFGEEWLFEALATCYLPLAKRLDAALNEHPDARLTLSLTPVLADQLAAPIADRFRAFCGELREQTHQLDIDNAGDSKVAAALEHSRGVYRAALDSFEAQGGNGLAPLLAHAQWTSSATHALLPLIATDAGLRLQVETGIASHRARIGNFNGGFWLPECAWTPWLEDSLAEAGVGRTCLDLTDHFGEGSSQHLRPLRLPSGIDVLPLDRETVELVWSPGGYPGSAAYCDTHHLTERDHLAWSNDGNPYDPALALAQAKVDAVDFVARTQRRLRTASSDLDQPALSLCALDTELLGLWWREGVDWLGFVIEAAQEAGLALVEVDAVDLEPLTSAVEARSLPTSSWGQPRTLETWTSPAVSDLVRGARRAELELLRATERGIACEAAVRELLALQASDWAFQIHRKLAGPYPHQRFDQHLQNLNQLLAADGDGATVELLARDVRNLAPYLSISPLRRP